MVLSISPPSIQSQIEVTPPPILLFLPLNYVDDLAQIYKDLKSSPPVKHSDIYLSLYQVCKAICDGPSMRRSLRHAFLKATTVHERIVFQACLKYDDRIAYSLSVCDKESGMIDIGSEQVPLSLPVVNPGLTDGAMVMVWLRDEQVPLPCERPKLATLSDVLHSMLYGGFRESFSEDINFREDGISSTGFSAMLEFSSTGVLPDVPTAVLFDILVFSCKYLCDKLKEYSHMKLAKQVSSRDDVALIMQRALEEDCLVLADSCLHVLLQDLPGSLGDEGVVDLLNSHQVSTMVGSASFTLYSLLSQVAMDLDPGSDTSALFLRRLVGFAVTSRQKMMAYHMLGCVELHRENYDEAESAFQVAFDEGHIYSVTGLARIGQIRGETLESFNRLSSVISDHTPLGWMHQERSLYCENNEKRWEDLDKATELDPTLTYPYMYRAASLMEQLKVQDALAEINKILGFRLVVECLELRFCFCLVLKDHKSALCDLHAILTISPDYRMFGGRVHATQFQASVRERVTSGANTDSLRKQLYDQWSAGDGIGSLSVIFQLLESGMAKARLYFLQHLVLHRLKCPKAAMTSLASACQHALSPAERLVFEGWILLDVDHSDEGLRKAKESLGMMKSFEALYLTAYALYPSQGPSSEVVALLKEAVRLCIDKLRRGQVAYSLGKVYVRSKQFDLATRYFRKALKLGHKRAHLGLAQVHYSEKNKAAAYREMTKFIKNRQDDASAYEKRYMYIGAGEDLKEFERLNPLRLYPHLCHAQASIAMRREREGIDELSRVAGFIADRRLLKLRSKLLKRIGDNLGAERDRRACALARRLDIVAGCFKYSLDIGTPMGPPMQQPIMDKCKDT